MEAAFVLLALFVSALALLPSGALAAGNQVTGLVYVGDCPTQTQTGFVQGAKVTLNDANGVQTFSPVTTGLDGSFAFTPATGTYWLNVSRAGYYGNQTQIFRFDGTQTIVRDICVVAQPTANYVVTFSVQNGAAANIAGATVSVLNVTAGYLPVTSGVTNSSGMANVALWAGEFQVRVTATGYQTLATVVNVTGSTTVPLVLSPGDELLGHARNSGGQFLSSGLVAWLYNAAAPQTSPYRMIRAVINGSLYDFHAPPANYQLIVDADGYAASNIARTISATSAVQDVTLAKDTPERYDTSVLYGANDWGNLTVYRNITLNPDSTMPFLTPLNLRNLRYQIDVTFGNGDGVVSSTEASAFTAWLQTKGPFYVTTDSFLLTNNEAYNSTVSSFTLLNAAAVQTALQGTGPVTIQTRTTYKLKDGLAPIANGAANYYVNATLLGDMSAPSDQNFTYAVQVPNNYEMLTKTVFGVVTIANFTRVSLDPGVQSPTTSLAQVKMTFVNAKNVTAEGKITDPAGKFYVVNSTFQHYQAYVAANATITFNAGDSLNPPSGDPSRANYTWYFEANKTCSVACKGYGLTATHKYTTPGEYIVNLTMVGSGGNVSYRNLTVWVDGLLPVANFRTNLTGSTSAIGKNESVNQGALVRFDAGLSSDLAYPGKNGIIPNGGYAWDFNGDRITDEVGRIQNYTFSKAGYFTVNLTVTDAVGWKAANVSMYFVVNDTTPPVPKFQILDPSNEWAVVAPSNLYENHTYAFNASLTTDNHDKNTQLLYNWTVPGPLIGETGTNHTYKGTSGGQYMNISFGWSEFNLSYAVKLNVTDTGFGSGKPNTGNLTQALTVQVCPACRPDLKINAGSLKISDTSPEEGATITVTVNVTNKPKLGAAAHVHAQVFEIDSSGQSTLLSDSPQWLDSKGNPLSNTTIASGSSVTLTFSVVVQGQGNKTIKVYVYDEKEPYTWITAENYASMSITARQPGWVNIAIIGSVLGVFVVVVFAMYYRRKVKAGEWQSRFRRAKKEKGEGEEKKPRKEKEAKEEKKRL